MPTNSSREDMPKALSYLGSRNSMYKIAGTFDVSEPFVSFCLSRVLEFLFSISSDVISWPMGAEREASKGPFLSWSQGKGPSNSVGCLDGSDTEILKPKESSSSYLNRKKFPYVMLQCICDARSRFIDIFADFLRSAHDDRVLRHSPFSNHAEVRWGLQSWWCSLSAAALVVGPLQIFWGFNRRHSQQREAIEHAFGILKQRFRRLYFIEHVCCRTCAAKA